MASVIDKMLGLAAAKSANIKSQADAEIANQQATYAPDYMRLTNENLAADIPYKQAQTQHTKALTSKVPAEIQQLLAQAFYQRMEGKYIPTKYNLEQQRVNQSQAELNQVSKYRGSYAKALADAQDIKNKYGDQSPEFRNALDYANRVATGASTSGGRSGGPNYVDPKTGKEYAQLTTAQKTRLEKGLSANLALAKDMPKVVASITPYLGAQGQGNYVTDTALSYAGLADEKIEKRLADYRDSSNKVIENVERAMNGLGVNITDQATRNLQRVLAPNKYDSPKSYGMRVNTYVEDLMQRARDQAELLRKGIPLDPKEQIITLVPEGNEGAQTINLQGATPELSSPSQETASPQMTSAAERAAAILQKRKK
jgi:hypothetical protein